MKKLNYIIFVASLIFSLCSCKKETTLETEYIDGQNFYIGEVDTAFTNNIEQFNSGTNSELASQIIVPPNSGLNLPSDYSPWTIIYSIKIPNLKKGDILSVTAKAEVTNNYSNAFLISGQLILGTNSTSIPGSQSIEISEGNGFNLLAYMQHGIVTYLGTYECSSDLGDKYVNLCLVSKQIQSSSTSNETLIVEKGYGRLTVTVFRK